MPLNTASNKHQSDRTAAERTKDIPQKSLQIRLLYLPSTSFDKNKKLFKSAETCF